LEENLLPQAEKDLRDAITLRQDSPHAQCLLAQVLKKQGRQQEALKVWNNTKESLKHNIPEQHECIKWANQRSQT
jgi:cytochrome c-type biogenesis protein CcmH/NrfG